MMLAPVRSVMAMQQSHCDMEDETIMSSTMPAHHDMSTMASMDMAMNMEQAIEHQCCCCDGDSCVANCEASITASLVMQPSAYLPALINVSYSEILSSDVINRELTPPSRPPANLHN